MHFLSRNNLPDTNQHGFVPSKSTCTQLLWMTQDFARYINEKIPFHVVYFDQKSAFDRVDHSLLLRKMNDLGISSKTVTWCRSYLTNRTFRVSIDGTLSEPRAAPSGVPQGGSLSPLLYVIFALDLREFLPPSVNYLRYADDVKAYAPVRDTTERLALQKAVDGVAEWCAANHMLLSASKCVVLAPNYDEDDSYACAPNYTIDGGRLPVASSTWDLGVINTPNLDFTEYVSTLAGSARNIVYCLFRCFIVQTPEFYLRLYKALVLSKFLYCSCVATLQIERSHETRIRPTLFP